MFVVVYRSYGSNREEEFDAFPNVEEVESSEGKGCREH